MTTTPETERRFGKLREDVDVLIDLQQKTHDTVVEIATTQHIQGRILEKHGGRLDRIEARLDEHGEKLDSHTERLDSHTEKLDSHTEKLDTILRLLENGRPDT